MTKYIILFVLFVFNGCAFGAQQGGIDWHNREFIIKGEYLRALLVAEKDFSSRIVSKANMSDNHGSALDNKLSSYLSKIDNYNIEIGYGKDRILIWIIPRLSAEFPVIFGGDALYTIDSKTFQLLDKRYGK